MMKLKCITYLCSLFCCRTPFFPFPFIFPFNREVFPWWLLRQSFCVALDGIEVTAIFLPQSPRAMISQSTVYVFEFEYVYHRYCLHLMLQYKSWRNQFTSFPPCLVLVVCHLINTVSKVTVMLFYREKNFYCLPHSDLQYM